MKKECPFCGGKLSEIRTDGHTRWQHCYSCHFEFPIKTYWKKEAIIIHGNLVSFKQVCSNCGTEAPMVPTYYIYDLVDTCPNCGMKMEYNDEA